MAKLTANVLGNHPDGSIRVLAAGDDLPEWAADQVGEHVLDAPIEPEPIEPEPPVPTRKPGTK